MISVTWKCVQTSAAVFLLSVCQACVSAQPNNSPIQKVTGIYSSFYLGEDSGDISGIEMVISKGANGAYYGTFQASEGVPRRPVVIDVYVDGNQISFTVEEKDGYRGKFRGIVDAAGISGEFLNGQLAPSGVKLVQLKRGASFWSVSVGE